MSGQYFPRTPRTALEALFRAEHRDGVNELVMILYRAPLRAYLIGTAGRRFGDIDDVVAGFFASRLQRPEFLRGWQSSDRPLRRWMMTAFRHHLLELARERTRARRIFGTRLREEPRGRGSSPEADFDRALAVELMHEARERAAAAMDAEGLGAHWLLLLQHSVAGVPIQVLALEHDLTPGQVKGRLRVARGYLRRAVDGLLAWSGIDEASLAAEREWLQRALAS